MNKHIATPPRVYSPSIRKNKTSPLGGKVFFPPWIFETCLNPSGKKLIANSLYSNATGHKTSGRIKLAEQDELQVIVACGPYTTSDNLSYEPLEDLLKYVEEQKPHVVLLCGPFVDAKHSMIDGCR